MMKELLLHPFYVKKFKQFNKSAYYELSGAMEFIVFLKNLFQIFIFIGTKAGDIFHMPPGIITVHHHYCHHIIIIAGVPVVLNFLKFQSCPQIALKFKIFLKS